MKKSKTNFTVIALVICLLVITIGYAAFQNVLTAGGTVDANGTFDIKFTTATSSNSTKCNPVIAVDGKSITADVTLSYPGDGVTITATIKNNGTVPAKLTSFVVTDENNQALSSTDIEVTFPSDIEDTTINAGDSYQVSYTIKWSLTSTAEASEISQTYKATFTYEQDTIEFN